MVPNLTSTRIFSHTVSHLSLEMGLFVFVLADWKMSKVEDLCSVSMSYLAIVLSKGLLVRVLVSSAAIWPLSEKVRNTGADLWPFSSTFVALW